MGGKRNELAPCGIYCGACPHYFRQCFGCSPEIREQEKNSKWTCRVRVCCYEKHGLNYCSECAEFPCTMLMRKHICVPSSVRRFAYRREVLDNLKLLREIGEESYLARQRERWRCIACGKRVQFISYKCSVCGKESAE